MRTPLEIVAEKRKALKAKINRRIVSVNNTQDKLNEDSNSK